MSDLDTSKGFATVIIGMIVATWGWLYAHISSIKAHGNGTAKVTQAVCDARFESLLRELKNINESIHRLEDKIG